MLSKPIKPKKTYSSFVFYLAANSVNGTIKCSRCDGWGVIYDPNDPRCPIEGNKCRNRIKCPQCDGSKIGTIENRQRLWREYLAEHKERVDKYKRELLVYQSIKKKLTKEELKILGVK